MKSWFLGIIPSPILSHVVLHNLMFTKIIRIHHTLDFPQKWCNEKILNTFLNKEKLLAMQFAPRKAKNNFQELLWQSFHFKLSLSLQCSIFNEKVGIPVIFLSGVSICQLDWNHRNRVVNDVITPEIERSLKHRKDISNILNMYLLRIFAGPISDDAISLYDPSYLSTKDGSYKELT